MTKAVLRKCSGRSVLPPGLTGDLPKLDSKRSHPDDKDVSSIPGKDPMRYRSTKKVPKKPGRKALTSEPLSKRKAQNRAAQCAFRERKHTYLKDLEGKNFPQTTSGIFGITHKATKYTDRKLQIASEGRKCLLQHFWHLQKLFAAKVGPATPCRTSKLRTRTEFKTNNNSEPFCKG
ncbi:hypothetical protein BGZ63DRAFT_468509 [Mariannaea sp. PMI_226]|nr:hypothetical protein BGZ63DRAFT_468509 [Mariannaea sp. PMI_226]